METKLETSKKQQFTAIRIGLITIMHFLRMRDRDFFYDKGTDPWIRQG